jgi:hypothetical protein
MTVEGYNEEIGGTAISRSIWTWARLAGGAAILAVLVWRVGAGPFVDGLRLTTAWALAAMAITSLTTLCCAWRWMPGAVMLVAGRGRSRDGACELTGAQAERVGGVVHA